MLSKDPLGNLSNAWARSRRLAGGRRQVGRGTAQADKALDIPEKFVLNRGSIKRKEIDTHSEPRDRGGQHRQQSGLVHVICR